MGDYLVLGSLPTILGIVAALVVILLGLVLTTGAFLLLIVIPLLIVITVVVVIVIITRKVKKTAKAFKEAEQELINELLGEGNTSQQADYEGTYTENN